MGTDMMSVHDEQDVFVDYSYRPHSRGHSRGENENPGPSLQPDARSEALRKAIERNRQKLQNQKPPSPPPFEKEIPKASDYRKPLSDYHQESMSFDRPTRPTSTAASSALSPSWPTLLDKKTLYPLWARELAAKISVQVTRYSIYAGWLFCFFVLLRLIFAEDGVLDFYKMEKTLDERRQTLTVLDNENNTLRDEIRKIQQSEPFQKKMAREHLGVIAENEFLILFAKEKEKMSI